MSERAPYVIELDADGHIKTITVSRPHMALLAEALAPEPHCECDGPCEWPGECPYEDEDEDE